MRHVSQSAVAAALLAGRVLGHPHPATSENNIQRRTVDLRAFPVGVGSSYANNLVLTEEKPQFRTFSAPTYVDTASQLVKKVAPGTEFRVVTSYQSDTGVGHVVFKQQVHGIDIDTADFNVNVSFTRKFNRPKANGSRLAKMARSFHTEILSSLELFQQRVH
jgi:extracellular elastinolytic metalloproteinase